MSESSDRPYSILITLYDPSLSPSSVSPLLPQTPSRLPPRLDQRLQSSLDDLVLPPTSRDFWRINLKKSRSLDTKTPSTLSAALSPPAPPVLTPSSATSRIWSQHFGLSSPPLAIQTAQLWTPSQALPLSAPPLPATARRTAVLDFRFGPIEIDSIKYPRMSSPSSSPSQGQTEPSSSGTTSLYWGTIHLYREAGVPPSYVSTPSLKTQAQQSDDGTTLALVSVPGVLNAAAILKFIEPALVDVEEVRMLRDSTPSRSIVVVKFVDRERAQEFRRMFNGKSYHDSKDSELCHVVPISSILLKPTSLPPYTFPQTPSPSLTNSTSTRTKKSKADDSTSELSKAEIPTCPICLEKLDSKVTGLVQIQCKHNYHCSCLLRWGDSRCPVCRATNLKPRSTNKPTKSTQDGESEGDGSSCAVCTSPSNLWICIICGNVGCGRYQGGHAHLHFSETGHSYSLELETGRIWSYIDDEYVHRLLRLPSSSLNGTTSSTSGGGSRLIELPSIPSSHSHTNPDDISSKIASSYGGPDRSAEEEQDKLEMIALEYSGLLQTSLEEQRGWYEEELAREKEKAKGWERKVGELEREVERERKEREGTRREAKGREEEKDRAIKSLELRLEGLEKELKRNEEERKKERGEWTRLRKGLERELEQEKSVTENLTMNLSGVRKEIEERKRETDGVKGEVEELKDQLNDLMTALTMRDRIENEPEGSELRGASIGIATGANDSGTNGGKSPSQVRADKRKKKNKKK